MKRFHRVLITGASRGLGAALAQCLAARGYDLMLLARSADELRALAAQLRDLHGVDVECVTLDLANLDAVAALCDQLSRDPRGVDVLVNNAGIGSYRALGEWTTQEIVDCSAVNITAPILLSRALIASMIANRRGMIVNIASDLARSYLANMAPYVASKRALLGFSGSLLREVKQHNIRVCSVLPGIIDTAFNGATEGSKEETWALQPAALAEQIADLLELPLNVVIDEMTIHPLHQDF